MKTREKSLLTPEQKDLMVRGQIGNTRAKISEMVQVLAANGLNAYVPYLEAIALEVAYLEEYLPPMKLRKPPK